MCKVLRQWLADSKRLVNNSCYLFQGLDSLVPRFLERKLGDVQIGMETILHWGERVFECQEWRSLKKNEEGRSRKRQKLALLTVAHLVPNCPLH